MNENSFVVIQLSASYIVTLATIGALTFLTYKGKIKKPSISEILELMKWFSKK